MIILMRVYIDTHGGLDTPTASQQMFDSEKLSQFFLVLLKGSLDLETNDLPTEPPRHHIDLK